MRSARGVVEIKNWATSRLAGEIASRSRLPSGTSVRRVEVVAGGWEQLSMWRVEVPLGKRDLLG